MSAQALVETIAELRQAAGGGGGRVVLTQATMGPIFWRRAA